MCKLVDVDLRWGVTEADAEHGKALDICLDEIDTCRPYFLGILGHRYGFVPEGHQHSITAQKISFQRGKESCYEWHADKSKYILREDVTPDDAEIIRSVYERYSIYQTRRSRRT